LTIFYLPHAAAAETYTLPTTSSHGDQMILSGSGIISGSSTMPISTAHSVLYLASSHKEIDKINELMSISVAMRSYARFESVTAIGLSIALVFGVACLWWRWFGK
jgi:hypothetical protein